MRNDNSKRVNVFEPPAVSQQQSGTQLTAARQCATADESDSWHDTAHGSSGVHESSTLQVAEIMSCSSQWQTNQQSVQFPMALPLVPLHHALICERQLILVSNSVKSRNYSSIPILLPQACVSLHAYLPT